MSEDLAEEKVLPLVTAIIPCHNHVAWVEDAVMSIVNQDYTNKRLIVLDDGSTDGSADKVLSLLTVRETRTGAEGLIQHFGQINDMEAMLVIIPKAHGPSFARNLGIKIGFTDTDIFAFLDSDDIYHSQKISKSIEQFMKAPKHVAVVYSDFSTFNPETGLWIRQYKEPFDRNRLLHECIINCDSLVSKHAIEVCGGFDESLRVCEDYDLWLRITETFLAFHLAEDLVSIRVGSHSSTDTVKKDLWNQCFRRVFEKLRERHA